MREKGYKHRVYVGNLKECEHLQGEDVRGSIKSVCTLNKCGRRGRTEWIAWNYQGIEVPENH
jgi:hypothetical protein